jgi:sugar O-acyltransferase (sialic acid O-acetyltransferase NeuD family)
MTIYITAPMINANEEEMTLVEWFRQAGEAVHQGETLCMLETTKSTQELQTETGGYFFPLVEAGQTVFVGQTIAALAESPEATIEPPAPPSVEPATTGNARRWTKKAELLAHKHGLDIVEIADQLGSDVMVTEKDILAHTGQAVLAAGSPATEGYANANPTERILILGGGNIAVLVLDILARIPSQRAIGILDDNPNLHGRTIQGCPVLGPLEDVTRLWEEGAFDAATLAIGVLPLRTDLFEKHAAAGIRFSNIVDPSALVLSDAIMGNGNLIMSFCRIGPEAVIGNNNFLSAYVSLEHHNVLGDHCTFGPGVYTSGGVRMGNRVRFGTGVFIEPRLSIGDDVTIASGIVLTANVPAGATVKARSNFIISPPAA